VSLPAKYTCGAAQLLVSSVLLAALAAVASFLKL
jgi:hypothetical protein